MRYSKLSAIAVSLATFGVASVGVPLPAPLAGQDPR